MSDEVHDQKFITDKEGNRVRRGLTHEENNWYEAYLRRRVLPEAERKPPSEEEQDRFLQLDDKHYAACAYLLDAENVLRVDKPPLN
ncbi:MAG: hypothetical protein WB662_07145 [Methyloceanibacter sp.]|jgi:hypothetical protein